MSPLVRRGPLLDPRRFRDTKDPCPIFDGQRWHIFGSGGTSGVEKWEVLHATAPSMDGPWTEQEPIKLPEVEGGEVAAPGVIYDAQEGLFHMFIQSDCFRLGGSIYHFRSADGQQFEYVETCLRSIPSSHEAGIYDPHPALLGGEHYLVYTGMGVVGYGDIFLARSASGTWNGPWERLGPILRHEEVQHHNQRDQADYEWGLEGGQLLQLPDGRILLNAVCFLPQGSQGTRQRVFFALANDVIGPYRSLGPVLEPTIDQGWGEGENGHATALLVDDTLQLFYQARSPHTPWRYGLATFSLPSLLSRATTAA